jgi:hypothetical protein
MRKVTIPIVGKSAARVETERAAQQRFVEQLQETAQMVARNIDTVLVARETLDKSLPIERLIVQPDKTRELYETISAEFLKKRAPLTLSDLWRASSHRHSGSAQSQLLRLVSAQLVELVEPQPGGEIGIIPLQAGNQPGARRLPLPPQIEPEKRSSQVSFGKRRQTVFEPLEVTPKLNEDPMLTLAQAAVYSGVPAKFLRVAAGKRAINALRFSADPFRWSPNNGTLLVRMSDLLDWLSENEAALTSRGFSARIEFEEAPARAWKLSRRLKKAAPLAQQDGPAQQRKQIRLAASDPYLTVTEAASLLPISTTAVRKALKDGQLDGKRLSQEGENSAKPRWLVKASALLNWFDRCLF